MRPEIPEVGAFFGSLAALSIGTTELFGRKVVALSTVLTASFVLQVFASVTALISAIVLAGDWSTTDAAWGVLSGLGLAVGMGAYFVGLARSSSTVVAPMVGTLVAVVPYTYALIRGADASGLAMFGAAVAFVGLILIAIGTGQASELGAGLLWGGVAGLGYGSSVAVLVETTEASGAWPVLTQRLISMIALGVAVVATGSKLMPPAGARMSATAGGVTGGLSSVFLILGVNAGATAAIVTSSMFPAVSVVLGYLYFSDGISRRQGAGVVLALVGVALVVGG